MGWDEATFQRVKELHRSGVSRRKIANLLGMTAGQVIGKMYRVGLLEAELERPTAHPRAPKKSEPRRAPATPIPVEKMEVAPLPPLRVTEDVPRKRLLDLERHDCRWPVGDPRQGAFGFCALPKAPDRPYCDAHTRRALMRDACQSATAHGADTSSPQG